MNAKGLGACLTVAAMLLGAACGSSALSPSDGFVALGTWGGDNTGMIVTDSAAHVHVGCTFGDMPGTSCRRIRFRSGRRCPRRSAVRSWAAR
jgi:hypothetical protein